MPDLSVEERLKRLEDEAGLKKLINTYHKRADAFDWAGWAETFTEDAVFLLPNSFGTLRGRQTIHDVCKGNMDHVYDVFQHIMINLDFEVDGSDTATGTANLIFTGLVDRAAQTKYYQSGGRYKWTFKRTPQGWRIAHAWLEFIWNNGADADQVFKPAEEAA